MLSLTRVVFNLGLSVSACLAQDLCSLTTSGRGFAPPLNADAQTALGYIGKAVPFETRNIKLYPSSNAMVKQRGGAAAQLCGSAANERWIFYDPTYVEGIKKAAGGSDFPRYFVLAHEAAHHINGDTLIGADWNKDQELAADYSAAVWLTRLGVTIDELLQTFNALGLPEESVNGYPTRCERRARVVQGYDDARKPDQPAAPIPMCDICSGESPLRALYLRESVSAGAALQRSNIVQCGAGNPSEDLPLAFERDIAGMCAVMRMTAGTRLTWTNLDVCALMRGRNQ